MTFTIFHRLKWILPVTISAIFLILTAAAGVPRQAHASTIQPARLLTIDERADCRYDIEQVYWEAMDWPAVNEGPKPALDQVLSMAKVEEQIADALAGTVALQERWGLVVTPAMLQAEIDRMAAGSQNPERLQTLFAGLDRDPGVVAECLVRPVLVDRLLRLKYGQDPEIHAGLRLAAAAALTGATGARTLAALPNAETIAWEIGDPNPALDLTPAVDGVVYLDEASFAGRLAAVRQDFHLDPEAILPIDRVSGLQEDAGRFYALAVTELSETRLEIVIATWEKDSFETWWAENRSAFSVNRFVQPVASYSLPDPAVLDSGSGEAESWAYMPAMPWATTASRSVWTGSDFLVWGDVTTNGFRYDPVLDDWRPITTLDAPHGRHSFTAVWTGTEMIVFGGCNGGSEFCTDGSGGRYNPLTDSWTAIANGASRRQHTAVWSGSEMLVWGGCREDANGNQNCNLLVEQGARYNPATNSWSPMTLTGAPIGLRNPRSVWAEDQMIIWNGTGAVNGRYFPATDSWQTISLVDGPPGLGPSLAWTGSEMIAWGGCSGDALCFDLHDEGGRYDPDTDTWTPTNPAGAPAARKNHTAVWTGDAMIVWGGYTGSDTYLNDGKIYDPATDTWSGINQTGAPSARGSHHAVWTGTEMIVWGGDGPGDERSGGRYNPVTGNWLPTTTNDPYRVANYHATVWDGVRMISWGGVGEQFIDPFYQRARIYDPVTDIWSMSSQNASLSPAWFPSAVWTGTEMIVWGGQIGSETLDEGARYNPLTDTWQPTSLTGVPEARANHTAVWTGAEMIVWGGSTWTEIYVKTGGRYNPQTDTWTATSTAGAPSARYLAQSVWTGTEMIVWGGQTGTGATNTGGKYDPVTNSWSPTSMTGAPSARLLFASVWTGSEFIVWGGGAITSGWIFSQTGGRYDPAADVWTPTSTNGAPEGRARTAAVWTGEELFAWGGCTGSTCLVDVHTGGLYNPATDTWTATTTDHVIEGREFHTMVWTGSEVIVWGGQTNRNGYTHIGGRYLFSSSDNSAAQANADAYETQAGEELIIAAPGVLENDSDPDSDPLTASLSTIPPSGVLDFTSDGSFSYMPANGFTGSVQFQYRAFDGQALSSPATVTIQVLGSGNSAPQATADTYETQAGEELIIAAPGVLGNDFDPDGDPMTAVLVAAPETWILNFHFDGSFTFTPGPLFTGIAQFQYRVYDGTAYSNIVTVTIEVDPVPPDGDFLIFLPVAIRP